MRRVCVKENGKGMAMERDSGGGRIPPPAWPSLLLFVGNPDLATLLKFVFPEDCLLPTYMQAQGWPLHIEGVGFIWEGFNCKIHLTYPLPCGSK
jgi:hypothetical protein